MEMKYLSTETWHYGSVEAHSEIVTKKYSIGNYNVQEDTITCTNMVTNEVIHTKFEIHSYDSLGRNYAPSIYSSADKDNSLKINTFKLRITKPDFLYFGLLPSKYEEFIKVQNEAIEVVKILTKKYCKNT